MSLPYLAFRSNDHHDDQNMNFELARIVYPHFLEQFPQIFSISFISYFRRLLPISSFLCRQHYCARSIPLSDDYVTKLRELPLENVVSMLIYRRQ